MCELERTGATRDGTGVRAATMPEKLGVRERVGEGSGVERNVRSGPPAECVQRLSDDVLTASRFALDEHGGARARVPRDFSAHLAHRKRAPHEGRNRRLIVRTVVIALLSDRHARLPDYEARPLSTEQE